MLQIAGALIAVCVLAYLIFHTASSFENELEVKTAYYTTMDLTCYSDAYIFRDEQVIESDFTGNIAYEINDGKKVSINEKVASVFSDSSSANAQRKINSLKKEIQYLESIINETKFSTPTITSLDKNINERISNISYTASHGNLNSSIDISADSIHDLELKYCILRGTVAHESLIKSYNNEIENLSEAVSKSSYVYSPVSGYYYSETDGFENIYTFEALNNLTYESFSKIKNSEKNISTNAGKIVKSSKWYIALEIETSLAMMLTKDSKYEVFFSLSNVTTEMKMEKRLDTDNENLKVIILSTSTIYDNFNFSRIQDVSITLDTYSGIAFPAEAVRTDYDATGASKAGVYILDETVVKFKTFTKLIEKNGYVLCAVPDSKNISAYNDKIVSLYDSVIVKGTNLYHNKVIKNVLKMN